MSTITQVSLRRRLTSSTAVVLMGIAVAAALVPLISLLWTVISRGVRRFDLAFVTQSMRGIVGAGGGASHAIAGSLLITGAATLMCVPLGVLAAVYMTEYGRGLPVRVITFLVDVMTGIPSIVVGLFAYAVASLFFGPGIRSGLVASGALVLLMLPVVIRSSEEMLRMVPLDLREASYALGAPRWRTIASVVLPTALPGITSGALLGVARIVGETAPLLLVAGFTDSMNGNLLDGRMATLPVFIYSQWQNQGADASAYSNRAWTAALVLVLFVLALNIAAKAAIRLTQRHKGQS
ncbi:MAG: phosphate ABC transporter permease PstA [Propionibacteriaceae bacterium]|nr:phosphate ABC transporter permease PstA [Propionibacteriaceae bacterium]